MTKRNSDFEELVRDIAGRLRHVCGHLCEEEFLALVESIAATKQKFLLRDHAEAILSATLSRPVTGNLARRLGTIPHARPLSSIPPRSTTETQGLSQ